MDGFQNVVVGLGLVRLVVLGVLQQDLVHVRRGVLQIVNLAIKLFKLKGRVQQFLNFYIRYHPTSICVRKRSVHFQALLAFN